jgi:DNA-binding response OmpR family regulator
MSTVLNIIVADERESAQEVAGLIERWGHRVKQAHDGVAAVDEARRLKPELVLVGLSLPGLNGFGVAHQLRQAAEFAETRFTALLNRADDAAPRELKRAGFTYNLVKPIVPLELLTSIVKTRDAIQRSRRLAQSSREVIARGRVRADFAQHGLEEYRQVMQISRQSLSRALPAVAEAPLSASTIIEILLGKGHLDADQRTIATKVMSSGEAVLSAWEAKIYARLAQRYLAPACKLCRYRIPQDEIVKSWDNGGYCALCSQAVK